MFGFSDNSAWWNMASVEEIDALIRIEQRKEFDKKHNIKRDKRGRLNSGALLAKKDNCNETDIIQKYMSGMTVKEIVECLGCSKSTVYNVIKNYKENL